MNEIDGRARDDLEDVQINLVFEKIKTELDEEFDE